MFQIYVTAPTDGIILPNPEIGDIRRMSTLAIIHETRGGVAKAFRDATWPIQETHVYDWALLNAAEKIDLESFFVTNAGVQIHILDHNGETWVGVLLTDVLDIRVIKEDCSYGASLEFLGVKV